MSPADEALARRLYARWRCQLGCVVEVQVGEVSMVIEAHVEGRSLLLCGSGGTRFVALAAECPPVLEGDEGAP